MAQVQPMSSDLARGASHNDPRTLQGNTQSIINQGLTQQTSAALVGDTELLRAGSTMSQSQTLTPSRGGTLKKRQSLIRKNSLKRTSSKKESRPGDAKGVPFANGEAGRGSEMNNAFYTPVPTTGSPTDILAGRFQGLSHP